MTRSSKPIISERCRFQAGLLGFVFIEKAVEIAKTGRLVCLRLEGKEIAMTGAGRMSFVWIRMEIVDPLELLAHVVPLLCR